MYETVDNSIVTAVFVALITREQDEDQVKEYLDELQFLALTADLRSRTNEDDTWILIREDPEPGQDPFTVFE